MAAPAAAPAGTAARRRASAARSVAPPGAHASRAGRPRSAGRGAARLRLFSPLTRRILAVNVLALALLGAAAFSISASIEASLDRPADRVAATQGEIFAAALGEGAVLDSADEGEVLLPDLARQMMRRLVEPTHTRARLFDREGRH